MKTYLQTRIFPKSQAAHPHVGEQHLATRVSYKVPVLGRHRQLQACGVAPVLQLIGEELHGHLLIMLVGLLQQVVGQLSELPAAHRRARAGHMFSPGE